MRAWWLVLLLLPLSTAQVATDDPDDVDWRVAGQAATDPADRHGAIDLTALAIDETEVDLSFRLSLAEVPAEGVPYADHANFRILFQHQGLQFSLDIRRTINEDRTASHTARLMVGDLGAEALDDLRATPAVTVDGTTLVVAVERESLSGAAGAPPQLGQTLEQLHVVSSTARIINICVTDCIWGTSASDRMPDDGFVLYTFEKGVEQTGSLRLWSKQPFRISNGGAGTYVLHVDVQNLGETSLAPRLSVEGVPDGWQVSLPAERVHVDGGDTESFPVLLTTPSDHEHGTTQSFLLAATAEEHAGRIELGIQYTNVPQPTGHHPVLYLHTLANSQTVFDPVIEDALGQGFATRPYMNALEDDPLSSPDGVPAQGVAFPLLTSGMRWEIPLSPGLGVGLDLDAASEGTLEATIEYGYLASDVQLTGQLIHEGRSGQTVLGELAPATPVSFGPAQQQRFEVPVIVGSDGVPYEADAQLMLVLTAEGVWSGPFLGPNSAPKLLPGGTLQLPLRSYHDPLDAFYQASRLLKFSTPSMEKQINPGESAVFRVSLHNGASDARHVELNLTGVNHDWARILGDVSLRIPGNSQRDVGVAVTVPLDAADASLADLVLQARDRDDPNRIAIMDVIAIVDSDADHPDETDQIDAVAKSLQGDKKSPGLGWLAVAACLFVMRRW